MDMTVYVSINIVAWKETMAVTGVRYPLVACSSQNECWRL